MCLESRAPSYRSKTAALNAAAASACMPGRTCWYTVIVNGTGVAEALADDFHGDAGHQQNRGVRMAQVVESTSS